MQELLHTVNCNSVNSLEHVADAEAHSLPAESGGRNYIEHRTPVKGDLERDGIEDVFETYLTTNSEADTAFVNDPEVGSGSGIESERTHGSDLEVVSSCKVHGTCSPASVNFEEVLCTESVLIRNFSTPTGTYTEGARLCASKSDKSE